VVTIDEDEDQIFEIAHDGHAFILDGDKLHCHSNYNVQTTIINLDVNDQTLILQVIESGPNHYVVQCKGHQYRVDIRTPEEEAIFQKLPKPVKLDVTKMLLAPMPGTVVSIPIKVGQQVVVGQEVCVIEAMKMQSVFTAQKDGIIKGVYVPEGKMVAADELIYELE